MRPRDNIQQLSASVGNSNRTDVIAREVGETYEWTKVESDELGTKRQNPSNLNQRGWKVNRKVQGMPQSQTAANPRHQEEEKKDKNIHAQN